MAQRFSKYIPLLSLSGDYVLLNLFFVLLFRWQTTADIFYSARFQLFFLYLNIVWLVLVIVFGAYTMRRNASRKALFFTYLKIIIFFFFFFLLYFQVSSLPYYDRSFIKLLFPVFYFILMGWKLALYVGFLYYRKKGYNYRKVLIIGESVQAFSLMDHFATNPWLGYRCEGLVGRKARPEAGIVADYSSLAGLLSKIEVDEVFMAAGKMTSSERDSVSEILSSFAIEVNLVPDLGSFALNKTVLQRYGDVTVIEVQHGPLSWWYNRLLKRMFDIIVSLVVVVGVLSWMTLLLWIIDKLSTRHGVIFKQQRTTLHGHRFYCYKYRSMFVNSNADELAASENDPRVTYLGRFLRSTSLDELPQFVNVLRGDMSVVGPRPHMISHTEQYRQQMKHFMLRHVVRPGITGLAQVNGFRGEIQKTDDLMNRLRQDMSYISNWSFWLDIKIILLTFWVLLRGQKKAY